ncbi:hypothetical protein HDU98_003968, partial [Podochytrium sp. JEL0797]
MSPSVTHDSSLVVETAAHLVLDKAAPAAYAFSSSQQVFATAHGAVSTPAYSARGRMLSLSVPASPSLSLPSKRSAKPLSVSCATVEGVCVTPPLLLGALLLDVSAARHASAPSDLPCARRIAALVRIHHTAEERYPIVDVPLPAVLSPSTASHPSHTPSASTTSFPTQADSQSHPGNDFARVESLTMSPQPHAHSMMSPLPLSPDLSTKPKKQSYDFVRFFNSVIDDGPQAYPLLDLDFHNDMLDSHFTRRYLNPM